MALADLHKELAPHYSEIGRPSIDPELMRPNLGRKRPPDTKAHIVVAGVGGGPVAVGGS